MSETDPLYKEEECACEDTGADETMKRVNRVSLSLSSMECRIIELYSFCIRFEYTHKKTKKRLSHVADIFYNAVLVFGNKRLAFLLDNDRMSSRREGEVIAQLQAFCPELVFVELENEGRLVFKRQHAKLFHSIYGQYEKREITQSEMIGLLLSYPCFKHDWSPFSSSLVVQQKSGVTVDIITNWHEDYEGDEFKRGVEPMMDYLSKMFPKNTFFVRRNPDKVQRVATIHPRPSTTG